MYIPSYSSIEWCYSIDISKIDIVYGVELSVVDKKTSIRESVTHVPVICTKNFGTPSVLNKFCKEIDKMTLSLHGCPFMYIIQIVNR